MDGDDRLDTYPPGASGGSERAGAPCSIDFASDIDGRIVWAAEGCAPMLAGLHLGSDRPGAPARVDAATAAALAGRRPLAAGRLWVEGAPQISGAWRIDAVPRLDPVTGAFLGHRGVLRRPTPAPRGWGAEAADDRLRQALHELRTPVNAIAGFAELIRQQLFGPVPEPYRGMADAIAADAAEILTAFGEIERVFVANDRPFGSADGDDVDRPQDQPQSPCQARGRRANRRPAGL